jgi:hypothetical protein
MFLFVPHAFSYFSVRSRRKPSGPAMGSPRLPKGFKPADQVTKCTQKKPDPLGLGAWCGSGYCREASPSPTALLTVCNPVFAGQDSQSSERFLSLSD